MHSFLLSDFLCCLVPGSYKYGLLPHQKSDTLGFSQALSVSLPVFASYLTCKLVYAVCSGSFIMFCLARSYRQNVKMLKYACLQLLALC